MILNDLNQCYPIPGGPLREVQALKILESVLTILFSVQFFFYRYAGTHSTSLQLAVSFATDVVLLSQLFTFKT